MREKKAIVAGFAEDIVRLAETVTEVGSCFWVDENTIGGTKLPETTGIVYVYSGDTGYSSQLLGIFTWLHGIHPDWECIVTVEPLEIGRIVFAFAAGFPVVSPEELRELLLNT